MTDVIEALTRDPDTDLATLAKSLGVTRQAVYTALRRHRPDLLEPRARPGARK